MDENNCYICNETVDTITGHPIVSKTKYTSTPICVFVRKFLQSTHLLRFHKNDLICSGCFEKLNTYDLACKTADNIERHIKELFTASEQMFLKEELVEFLESDSEETKASDAYHEDFHAYQTKYDDELANHKSQMNVNEIEEELDGASDSNVCFVIEYDQNSQATGVKRSSPPKAMHGQAKSKSKEIRRQFEKCPDCDELFASKTFYKTHRLRYHNPKKCGICQKVFPNQIELRDHNKTHHELQSKFECDICGKTMKSDACLWRHMKQHEDGTTLLEDSKYSYRCELCGHQEKSEEELKIHVDLHENRLKCVLCGAEVKHKANLILHMRIHTGEKFYQCDKCGKEFVHKSSLRMHLQTTHSEVRKKQCPECPLKFKTTSQLNQHLLTHSGVKNHQCPECGKLFAQRYNMMAHYKLHIGISRLDRRKGSCKCPICDMEFDRPSALKLHTSRIHENV